MHPTGTITVLDVGEGDALLVESAGKAALVDTGNLITGNRVLATLRGKGISHLEAIILTHPHPDHIGGVFQIAQSVSFSAVHDNDEPLDGSLHDMYRWYAELIRGDKRYSPLSSGKSITVGEIALEVISPHHDERTSDWNTNSLVMHVTAPKFSALFMGDGNIATEASLIRSEKNLKASILKVGHHGSLSASSEAFLKRVDPEVAIVSVNAKNIRGYPARAVIDRLARYSKVYATSEDGDVTVSICGDGTYDISTSR